ncbi:MAG: zinc-finger domain-containing protein [Sandarakinorhabdus sp.]|nr:zinc-finger domain-containing protein [Sandarakinorhabdus sp.]
MIAEKPPAPPPPETRTVTTRRVACDGDEGALGHPRVWLQIDARGHVDCPYCDRRFILQADNGGDRQRPTNP